MKEELLDRFLRYVKVYTPSSEDNESATPSSQCQFDLARVLEEDMKQIGLSDVYVDEHCYVYGNIPASKGYENEPAIGFIAHIDTVSDYCRKPAVPLVHENYDGEDIYLKEGDITIKVNDFPYLKKMKGRTIITTDGTTVLGADDKAGVAEILTMADQVIKSGIPHGKISIAFTPDEEIGHGASLLDLDRFGADFAYTADGDLEGGIEYETFNAAACKVLIKGVNVHPGSAKNIMINSSVAACEFNALLPEDERPENTEGYEGFFHLRYVQADVEKGVMYYIVRDHDRDKFEARKQLLRVCAEKLNQKYGPGTVTVEIEDTYYNMMEILKDHMEVTRRAKDAVRKAGLEPRVKPVRGGTDGSQLSFRGLPCPNLGTGGGGYHGPYEHASLEGMELAVKIMMNIVSAEQ